jgi:hypothetical protein
MHQLVVHCELPDGKTLPWAVAEVRKIVAGTVGQSFRLQVLARADGSTPMEIVWPEATGVSPQLMLASIAMMKPFPAVLAGVLSSLSTPHSRVPIEQPPPAVGVLAGSR